MTIFTLESLKLALEYREKLIERTGKINNLIWVEYYGPHLGILPYDDYSIVQFEKDTWTPTWNRTSINELAEITSYPEDDFVIGEEIINSKPI